MPKQEGENPITGTFGDLNFYKRKGQYLVRQKPGPSRKKFKTHPHFERPRAQSELFGRLSTFCGQLRRTLRRGNVGIFDGNINGRMMKLFSQVSKLDPEGQPGDRVWQRAIHLPQAAGLLTGFAFDDEHPISRILQADLEVVQSGTDKLVITARPRRKMIRMPKGGTHIGMEFFRLAVCPGQRIERDGIVTLPPTLAAEVPRSIELTLMPPECPGPWLTFLRLTPFQESAGQLRRMADEKLPTEIVGVRMENAESPSEEGI